MDILSQGVYKTLEQARLCVKFLVSYMHSYGWDLDICTKVIYSGILYMVWTPPYAWFIIDFVL